MAEVTPLFGTPAPNPGAGGRALGGGLFDPAYDPTTPPPAPTEEQTLPFWPTMDDTFDAVTNAAKLRWNRLQRDYLRGVVEGAETEAEFLLGEPPSITMRPYYTSQVFNDPSRYEKAARAVDRANSNRPLLTAKEKEVEDLLAQPQATTGGLMIRDLSRFVIDYATISPVMRAVGLGAKSRAFLAGGMADVTAYDPSEQRLSNILADTLDKEYPVAARYIREHLASDPEDLEGEARRKQFLEGALLLVPEAAGELIAGLWRWAGVLRKAKTEKKAAEATGNPEGLGKLDLGTSPSPRTIADFRTMEIMDELAVQEFRGGRLLTDDATNALRIEQTVGQYRHRLSDEQLGLSSNDIEAKAAQFKQLLEANLLPLRKSDDAGREINRQLDEAHDILNAKIEDGPLLDPKVVNLVDRSGNLKRDLFELGPAGRKAVMDFELTAGANPRAGLEFGQARDQIFGQLSSFEQKELDKIISNRTAVEILTRKPDFKYKKVNDVPGGRSPTAGDFTLALKDQQNLLGPERFALLMDRANKYFETMRRMVDELETNRLISSEEAEALKRWDYSPTQFISQIDPVQEIKIGRESKSVTSSGIEPLKKGDDDLINTDTEAFLAQVIGRTYGKIFRNRASLALKDVAEQVPDNGIVSLEKREGWVPQFAMRDGELEEFFVEPNYFREFAPEPYWSNNAIATIMGINLVKPLATGINPAFILTNFPRDLMHVWLGTSAYSPVLPLAMLQGIVDIGSVFKDTWDRKGRFQDYIKEGGGMELMTHQGLPGRGTTVPVTVGSRKRSAAISQAMHFLGYLNETSEILTRLAHRERLIKEGMDPTEATWEARRRLDFSQGGRWTKAAENFVPYVNAAAQGYRTIGRSMVNDPVQFAAKTGQLATVFGGMYLANQGLPGFDDIPDHVRNQGMQVMIPGMFYDDDDGRHYAYINIPIDHSGMPLKALVDSLLGKEIKGKNPTTQTVQMIDSMVGIVPGMAMPPLVSALIATGANYDWWRNDQIWKGGAEVPFVERYQINPDIPTSPLAVDLAKIFDAAGIDQLPVLGGLASPMQLQTAGQALVPTNIYTDIAGWSYAAATRGLDPRIISDNTMEMLQNTPILNRILKFTHPYGRFADVIEEATEEAAGEKTALNRELDFQVDAFLARKPGFTDETIMDWIKKQPQGAERVQLYDRYQNIVETRKILDRANLPVTAGPPPVWWISLSQADRKVRARMFLEEWNLAHEDDEFGDQRVATMRSLLKSVPGFKETQFGDLLREMRRDFYPDTPNF